MTPIVADRWKVTVPEGVSGDWSVGRFTVTEEASALSTVAHHGRTIPPGTYTQLSRGTEVFMSDTPCEVLDHAKMWEQVQARGGRVLIHGLGLGVLLGPVLSLDTVTRVDVVEIEADVIRLVWPTYAEDPRLVVYHADAFEKRWPASARWDVVWHDIWPDISRENQLEMTRLMRRFRGRCGWQDCWSRDQLRRMP